VFVCSLASAEEKKPANPKISAEQAKAAFTAKFTEYKAAIRDVEKLQAEFQTADAAQREKAQRHDGGSNHHAQSLCQRDVEAGEAAYARRRIRIRGNELLFTVAKYYTIGRQIGPGVPSRRNPKTFIIPSTAANSTSGRCRSSSC